MRATSFPAIETISLPDHALIALRVLEEAGHEAWLVGGFVRDLVLGRECHDIDIACSAHWTETQRAFEAASYATHETGVKHGTLTVVIGEHAVEITSYRSDGSYEDGRHPSSISFVRSIEEDLARRDFTINALAFHPRRGFADPFGGIDDLLSKTIRSVGDPGRRFDEDALRILRGCRFASQLGFTIDDDTLSAMKSRKSKLRKVSTERITHEIELLLLGDHVHDAIMACADVLSFALPELVAMKGFDQRTPYHIYDVLEHTAWVVQHTPPERILRWAALLHDMGKPAAAFDDGEVRHFYSHAHISVALGNALLDRLLISPTTKERILALVRHHDDIVEANPKAVKRMLVRLGGDTELFRMLCDLKRADALSQAPHCAPRAATAEELQRILEEVVSGNEAFTLKHLAVNGKDIMELGVAAGPAIGAALKAILNSVVDEEIPNEREALLARAKSWLIDSQAR